MKTKILVRIKVEDPRKKIDVANKTLNCLISGDFQSLGKELGLEVPSDQSLTENKGRTSGIHMETSTNKGENNIPSIKNNLPSIVNAVSGNSTNQQIPQGRLYHQVSEHGGAHKHEFTDGDQQSSGKTMQIISSENVFGTNNPQRKSFSEAKTPSRVRQSRIAVYRKMKGVENVLAVISINIAVHLVRQPIHPRTIEINTIQSHGERDLLGKRVTGKNTQKHHKHKSRDSRNKHSRHVSEKENVRQ